MGRRCEYPTPKPAPADASRRLAEAMLATNLVQRERAVVIQCESSGESRAVWTALRQLRDGYSPKHG